MLAAVESHFENDLKQYNENRFLSTKNVGHSEKSIYEGFLNNIGPRKISWNYKNFPRKIKHLYKLFEDTILLILNKK